MTRKSFNEGLARLQSARPLAIDLAQTVQLQEGVVPLAGAKLIGIDLIQPNPHQARTEFPIESLEELAASIRERGLLQPIRVRPHGDGFQLVAGERRWRAARMAGLTEVPAIVSGGSESDAIMDGLIENLQREDLNPVDRAEGLRHLKSALGEITWEQVAAHVGLTERRVFQLLDVARLPESLKADLRSGRLTEKHTRALRGLPAEVQEEMRQTIERESLPAHRVPALVRAVKQNPGLSPAEAVQLVIARPDMSLLATQCNLLITRIESGVRSMESLSPADRAHLQKTLGNLLERIVAALARVKS